MRVVVITLPHHFKGEAEAIERLLRGEAPQLAGHAVETLHLRKPHSSVEQIEELLRSIDPTLHPRIVLHDGFSLTERYLVRGVHVSYRNPLPPHSPRHTLYISGSCHTIAELSEKRTFIADLCADNPYYLPSYLFLSPIFDSISKEGYQSQFSDEELRSAHSLGAIQKDTYALGGVTLDKIDYLHSLGFGGVAMLGGAWERVNPKHKD